LGKCATGRGGRWGANFPGDLGARCLHVAILQQIDEWKAKDEGDAETYAQTSLPKS
jgi:hypothetical protein